MATSHKMHVEQISRRIGVVLAVVLLALPVLNACSNGDGGSEDQGAGSGETSGQVDVVVSLSIFASMVEAVGGEHISVSTLVPPGADPHSYQPSPSDARELADADVIFVNGLGLEAWLDGLLESAGGADAPVVELAADLEEHTAAGDDGEHEQEEDGHEHPEGNPHLWLNPEYGIHYVERIESALSEIDPDFAVDYQSNTEEYISEIEAFDEWASEQVARIPPENRKLVTFHDAFPYFAEHYGLDIVGVIIQSPGREPGAQEIAELVDEIEAQGVPAIFIEPQFNPDIARTIGQEAGVDVYELYSDATDDESDYLDILRLDIEHVVEALSAV